MASSEREGPRPLCCSPCSYPARGLGASFPDRSSIRGMVSHLSMPLVKLTHKTSFSVPISHALSPRGVLRWWPALISGLQTSKAFAPPLLGISFRWHKSSQPLRIGLRIHQHGMRLADRAIMFRVTSHDHQSQVVLVQSYVFSAALLRLVCWLFKECAEETPLMLR